MKQNWDKKQIKRVKIKMWKKDKRVYAAGFILIGFFIRNLVKRNVKNGPKQQQHREKNASSIIHQRDTQTHARNMAKGPIEISENLHCIFFACVVCRSLIYSILFSKRMPVHQSLTTQKNKFVSAHIIMHRFRFRFAWYRNVMSFYI